MMSKKSPQLRFEGFTDDWEERKLGEIGSFKNGMNFGKDAMGHGSPFVNLQNIFGKNIVDDTTLELAESTEKQKVEYSLIKGDVLFIRSSVKPSGVGEAALVDSNLPDTTYSGFIIRFRPKIDIDNNFKRFAFGTKYVRNQIMARATSSANTNINQDSLSLIQVGLPNLKEQEKIGSFFKQLDATIALHQRKLDLLKEQKKGFLQKMFPKNGEKVPELRFAGFADDWEERKFKDILKTHSFRSYLAGVSENGEYEVIQQGDKPIVGYSDGEPFTDYKDVTLFGDHTVSLYKPKSPFFVATDGVKILSADNFEGNYLYTTLERYKPEPQGYKRHFTILKNQDVWFTENMEEQQKIGSFFKQLDETIDIHQHKLDLLKEQKKGFLQKMFV
ncbi:restriction endonuclease subunit S [Lactococcus piscium]|uniref:Type I restriction-modification system, specificity subunit HsdS n=1 Tax=Pseudolactococcus piscium MKFS47 TaxID=297352 RepID=A0A0D6E059_9LACT|nr:restriction endonuclease subunit S [Lactococcus piscium]CEN29593.1 Type I restriction-modification system, specificity subunit HsdS [Lactococcus piscium MKFS47]